jgi:hypothetical protein
MTGSVGTFPTGVTEFEAPENPPTPISLIAATANEYTSSSLRPVIQQSVKVDESDEGHAFVCVVDEVKSSEVMVYPIIGLPPSSDGAVQLTSAASLPPEATTFVGAPAPTMSASVTASELSSKPTATQVVTSAQLTPLNPPPPELSDTEVDDDQDQIDPELLPSAYTAWPSEASSCPTATQEVALGQFTPMSDPPPELSPPISAESDHVHELSDSVPAENISLGVAAVSTPTATHEVEVGQLTLKRFPPPEPSDPITVETDQVQLLPDLAPEANIVSPPPSPPTATQDVELRQLIPKRKPLPEVSARTTVDVVQFHAPAVSVPLE